MITSILDMLLEVKNIVKRYSSHLALDDVNLNITEGSIYGLLGPNGAGKSTLIRIINKIILPDEGTVFFKNAPMSTKDVFNIGYLPEERGLYKKMKVWDHALFLAELKGLAKKEATIRLNRWFDKFDIQNWRNKKIEELSKGMQQKVQFLTSIIHDPDLLILDEPFSGFDPVNAELLKNEILDLKAQGKTIVLSTHNMESVEELCDEISLVNRSKIVLQGNVSAIKNEFKKNILLLKLKTDNFKPENYSHFQVISALTDHNNTCLIRIQKKEEVSNSSIIAAIAPKYEILSFEEELPSMNEIFINRVKCI